MGGTIFVKRPPGWRPHLDPHTFGDCVKAFGEGLVVGTVVVGGIAGGVWVAGAIGCGATAGAGAAGASAEAGTCAATGAAATSCGGLTVTSIATAGPVLSAFFNKGAELLNTPENIEALEWYEQVALDQIEEYSCNTNQQNLIEKQLERLQMIQDQLAQWGVR
jgi:hypothetical protein